MAGKGTFGDLSGRQLIAGALAAMTSAWMASWLGVAGTLIGAAVGSVVAGIATALYQASIDRGIKRSKDLLAVDQDGRSMPEKAGGEDGPGRSTTDGVSWSERLRRVNWRSTAVAAVATLLAALLAIGVYEMVTGKSYGNSSNPTIVPSKVTRGGGAEQPAGPGEQQTPEQDGSGATTPTEPTESAPTGSTPPTQQPTPEAPTQKAPAPQGEGESGPIS